MAGKKSKQGAGDEASREVHTRRSLKGRGNGQDTEWLATEGLGQSPGQVAFGTVYRILATMLIGVDRSHHAVGWTSSQTEQVDGRSDQPIVSSRPDGRFFVREDPLPHQAGTPV